MREKKLKRFFQNRENKHNRDIRQMIQDRELTLGMVANAIGTTRDELSKRMRQELPPKQKHIILEAIERLSN